MSKEYRFRGKTYVIRHIKNAFNKCAGCAFWHDSAATCRKFMDSTDSPSCGEKPVIFIEKPKTKDMRGTVPSKRFEKNNIQSAKSMPKIIISKKSSVTKEINDKIVESVKIDANPHKLVKAQEESVVAYCKETSWGVNPANNVEIRSNRVIADKRTTENTWSFQLRMDNGYRPASISVAASKTAENCKFIAAILPDTERFIVCLLENGNLAPSDSPKIHTSRESAEKEAERLCKLYHQEFVVLQVVSVVKPQEPKKEVFA